MPQGWVLSRGRSWRSDTKCGTRSGGTELVGIPVERRFLEIVGADRPVELVGEVLDDVLEGLDVSELVRVERGHGAAFSSIQHTSSGFGASDRHVELLQVGVLDVLEHGIADGLQKRTVGRADRGVSAVDRIGSAMSRVVEQRRRREGVEVPPGHAGVQRELSRLGVERRKPVAEEHAFAALGVRSRPLKIALGRPTSRSSRSVVLVKQLLVLEVQVLLDGRLTLVGGVELLEGS
jgi:hypothetical protein